MAEQAAAGAAGETAAGDQVSRSKQHDRCVYVLVIVKYLDMLLLVIMNYLDMLVLAFMKYLDMLVLIIIKYLDMFFLHLKPTRVTLELRVFSCSVLLV